MGPYHADPAQPLTAEIDDLLILSEVCALVQPTVTGADGVFFLHTKKGNTTGRLQKEIGYPAPPSLAPPPPPPNVSSPLCCAAGALGARKVPEKHVCFYFAMHCIMAWQRHGATGGWGA